MTLPTHEFIRRFLTHVLPKGLHRTTEPLRSTRQSAIGIIHNGHWKAIRALSLTGAD
jgi:hypothetical protein